MGTVALAGMTPPLTILEELLFLLSPPLLFFVAAIVAAPLTPGSVLVKAAGSTAITALNLVYLTHEKYARLPVAFVYKWMVNSAGAHH